MFIPPEKEISALAFLPFWFQGLIWSFFISFLFSHGKQKAELLLNMKEYDTSITPKTKALSALI